jgi:hypothetical protein
MKTTHWISSDYVFRGVKTLHSYLDGSVIRPATLQEASDSEEQARHDGGSGVIIVDIDGKPFPCYVE